MRYLAIGVFTLFCASMAHGVTVNFNCELQNSAAATCSVTGSTQAIEKPGKGIIEIQCSDGYSLKDSEGSAKSDGHDLLVVGKINRCSPLQDRCGPYQGEASLTIRNYNCSTDKVNQFDAFLLIKVEAGVPREFKGSCTLGCVP